MGLHFVPGLLVLSIIVKLAAHEYHEDVWITRIISERVRFDALGEFDGANVEIDLDFVALRFLPHRPQRLLIQCGAQKRHHDLGQVISVGVKVAALG
jgi:hypothetical protein